MSVTVVLLTYECAHRIAPVVAHLQALDLPIVVVDNASTDGTADVVRGLGLDVAVLPRNIGAAARNVGAARARTPYVLFCDDDGWYERDGLEVAVDLLERHPRLAVVNARIVVGSDRRPDAISETMARSPLPDRDGIPGPVLLSFMAGAVLVRTRAFEEVGGYDPRWFLGGEEETLAWPLLAAGWRLRYVPELVMHHWPSQENATRLRAEGLRNTLVTAWLHRSVASAARWTAFTLADAPKDRSFVRGLALTLAAVPTVLRERRPVDRQLDRDAALLDAERFATRRPVWNRRTWRPDPDRVERPPAPAGQR